MALIETRLCESSQCASCNVVPVQGNTGNGGIPCGLKRLRSVFWNKAIYPGILEGRLA